MPAAKAAARAAGGLTGPARGAVDLPLHVVWSGRRSYGLEQPRSRMSLYRTVLAEGQRQDLIDFLNRNLLLAQWPVLRTLISRPIRTCGKALSPSSPPPAADA